MDTKQASSIPADVMDDLRYAIELSMTGARDPAFEQRIRAETDRIREKIFRKYGVLDIGTAAIRELRDGE